jgi:plastocyanin
VRSVFQILGAASIALAAACGGGGDGYGSAPPGGNPGGGGGGGPTATNAVSVSDDQFAPSAIRVAPGTTVTWTWAQGSSEHNVTFQDAASQTQGAGSTYSRAFQTAGTFTYHCTRHSGMSGTVTVQ